MRLIAIDSGGTNLRVALTDENLNILAVRRRATIHDDPLKLYEAMVDFIHECLAETGEKEIDAIGMSMCGVVDSNNVGKVGNLGIDNFDFVSLFERDFPSVPLLIANDGNCSSLTEALYGVNKGLNNSAFVTISTGIGLGIVLQGEMVNTPLEAGRIIVEYKGKNYEFEALVSGNGIVNLCKINGLIVPSAFEFFQGVRAKKSEYLAVYNEWIKLLSFWFANLQLLFNFDQFALSGGVMKSKDVFLDDLERISNAAIASWHLKPCHFVEAKFAQDVGIVAAATLALKAATKKD